MSSKYEHDAFYGIKRKAVGRKLQHRKVPAVDHRYGFEPKKARAILARLKQREDDGV